MSQIPCWSLAFESLSGDHLSPTPVALPLDVFQQGSRNSYRLGVNAKRLSAGRVSSRKVQRWTSTELTRRVPKFKNRFPSSSSGNQSTSCCSLLMLFHNTCRCISQVNGHGGPASPLELGGRGVLVPSPGAGRLRVSDTR